MGNCYFVTNYSFSLLCSSCPIDKIMMIWDHTTAPTCCQHLIQTKTSLPLNPPQNHLNKPKSNNHSLLTCIVPHAMLFSLSQRGKRFYFIWLQVCSWWFGLRASTESIFNLTCSPKVTHMLQTKNEQNVRNENECQNTLTAFLYLMILYFR